MAVTLMTHAHDSFVPILDDADIDQLEQRVERVAVLMDSAVRVPGTGWRFGADSVLGLIPGVGDLASAGVSAWLIYEANRIGMPGSVTARMVGNVALDTVVGSVPVVGNIFDFFFKANLRNVALMRREIQRLRADRAGGGRAGSGPIIDLEPLPRKGADR